jgi:hypothetical protein
MFQSEEMNGVGTPNSEHALRNMLRAVQTGVDDFLAEERRVASTFVEERRHAQAKLSSFGGPSSEANRCWKNESTRLTGELDQGVAVAKKRLAGEIRRALQLAGIEL